MLVLSYGADKYRKMNLGSNPRKKPFPVEATGMTAMAGGIRKVIGKNPVDRR